MESSLRLGTALSVLLFTVTLLSPFCNVAAQSCLGPVNGLNGDVNGDNVLTISDLTLLTDYLCELNGERITLGASWNCPVAIDDLNIVPDTTGSCVLTPENRQRVEEYGDVDCNCSIDVDDLIYFYNYLFCTFLSPCQGISVSPIEIDFCVLSGLPLLNPVDLTIGGTVGESWSIINSSPYVQISSESGTTPQTIEVGVVDIDTLWPGSYQFSFSVLDGDTVSPGYVDVLVNLEIIEAFPDPFGLYFSYTRFGPPVPDQLLVLDGSPGAYWAFDGLPPEIASVSRSSGQLPDSIFLEPAWGDHYSFPDGPNQGEIFIKLGCDSTVSGNVISVPVTFEISTLLTDQDSLYFNYEAGGSQPAGQWLMLSGTSGLPWQLVNSPSLFAFSSSSGVVPDSILISLDPGVDTLPPGDYQEAVFIEGGDTLQPAQFPVWLGLTISEPADNYLELDSALTISTDTTFDSVLILPGGILTANASITSLGNFLVDSGGVVTHSSGLATGLHLVVDGLLRVDEGGAIRANGVGTYNLPENRRGGSYGGTGYLSSPSACYGVVEEALLLGQGGHLTRGGGLIHIEASEAIVDGVIQANGQHGGGTNCAMANSAPGGGSGGSVQIEATSLSGNGTISANGGNGDCNYLSNRGGGGGGGRIVLRYDTANTTFPTTQAYGGTGNPASTDTRAAAGTIYLRPSRAAEVPGELRIENGGLPTNYVTPLRSSRNEFSAFDIGGRANVSLSGGDSFGSQLTINQHLLLSGYAGLDIDGVDVFADQLVDTAIAITSNATLSLGAGVTVSQGSAFHADGGTFIASCDLVFMESEHLQVTNGGTFEVQDSAVVSVPDFSASVFRNGNVIIDQAAKLIIESAEAIIPNGVTVTKDGSIGTSDDRLSSLHIDSGGVVTHSLGLATGLHLVVDGLLRVDEGGAIRANGVGTYNLPENRRGGSYGGTGYLSSPSACYGVVEEALLLGQGGHLTRGGGLIHIEASEAIVDGVIQANGQHGGGTNCAMANSAPGGGSGGSVQIEATSLSGNGTISANGGNGDCNYLSNRGGGGGGGRIVLRYDTANTTFPTTQAYGGTGNPASTDTRAAAGTIYLRPSRAAEVPGELRIENGGLQSSLPTPIVGADTTSDRLSVFGQSIAQFEGNHVQTAGLISVQAGSSLQCDTLFMLSGSEIIGTGTIIGQVVSDGRTSPGLSPGRLTIQGGLQMQPDHILAIEIGGLQPGTDYDVLSVAGPVAIDGTLELELVNGYVPGQDDNVQFLGHQSQSGNFANVMGIDESLISLQLTDSTAELVFDSIAAAEFEVIPEHLGFYYEKEGAVPSPQKLYIDGPVGEAWSLSRAGSWLQTSKTSGTFPDSVDISVVNLESLADGVYQSSIAVISHAPDSSTLFTSVSLHVEAAVEVGSEVVRADSTEITGSIPIYISHDTIAGFFIPLSYANSTPLFGRAPTTGFRIDSASVASYYELRGTTIEIDTSDQFVIVYCPLQPPPLPPPDTSKKQSQVATLYYTALPSVVSQIVFIDTVSVPCPDNDVVTSDSTCSIHYYLPDSSLYVPNFERGEVLIIGEETGETFDGLLNVDQDSVRLFDPGNSMDLAITQIGDSSLAFTVTTTGGVSASPTQGRTPADLTIVASDCSRDICYDTVFVTTVGGGSNQLVIEVVQTADSLFSIGLGDGWNLVSWNVDSDVDSTEAVLQRILPDVEVVLGFEGGRGLTYAPELQEFSTLRTMNHKNGYWIRMRAGSAQSMSIGGDPVPTVDPKPLLSGWNLVSYLPDFALPVWEALQSLIAANNLVVAYGFDAAGIRSYVPGADPFNTLDSLAPGCGYWINVLADQDLVYPSGPSSPVVSQPRGPMTSASRAEVSLNSLSTPEWVNVYSTGLRLDGATVTSGALITAVAVDGDELIGADTVGTNGKFGFMPVYAGGISSLKKGEPFRLIVDGIQTTQTFTWSERGAIIRVDELSSRLAENDVLPGRFALHQNYPNPFNMGTVIAYDLPIKSNVSLLLFNVLGQEVAVIYKGEQEAGHYELKWQALDSRGSQLASGVYFLHLEAGDNYQTRKLILLK